MDGGGPSDIVAHSSQLNWLAQSEEEAVHDDLHQLLDCVVESASKQHWRRIGARSAKEARSYFATTLRRAWGVHFAREFARHRIRRVVFVGAPRRQPGRPLATADGDWPALSAGEFAAHALRVGGAWAGGPPGRR